MFEIFMWILFGLTVLTTSFYWTTDKLFGDKYKMRDISLRNSILVEVPL